MPVEAFKNTKKSIPKNHGMGHTQGKSLIKGEIEELKKKVSKSTIKAGLDKLQKIVLPKSLSKTQEKPDVNNNKDNIVYQGEHVVHLFDHKDEPHQQFDSDIKIWEKTLHQNLDDRADISPDEKKVHKEQLQIIKRDIISRAFLGLEPRDNEHEMPITQKNIPLAALLSHGDRHAYQADNRELGEKFRNELLFGGKSRDEVKLHQSLLGFGTRSLNKKGRKEGIHAGLYTRRSSHQQRLEGSKWIEMKGNPAKVAKHYALTLKNFYKSSIYLKSFPKMLSHFDSLSKEVKKFAGNNKNSLGMNIPLGGVGNIGSHGNGQKHIIETEGAMKDPKGKILPGHQHGHAYFKENSDKDNFSLMVGYEGSAPSQASMVGKHDAESMVKKNKRSITGQSKADEIGIARGLGEMKSKLDEDKFKALKNVIEKYEYIELHNRKKANELISKLLSSENDKEREDIIREINGTWEKEKTKQDKILKEMQKAHPEATKEELHEKYEKNRERRKKQDKDEKASKRKSQLEKAVKDGVANTKNSNVKANLQKYSEKTETEQQLKTTTTWEPEEKEKKEKLEQEFRNTTFYYGTTRGKFASEEAKGIQKAARHFSDKLTKNRLNKYDKLKQYRKLEKRKNSDWETWDEKKRKDYYDLKKHYDDTPVEQRIFLRQHKLMHDKIKREVEKDLKERKKKEKAEIEELKVKKTKSTKGGPKLSAEEEKTLKILENRQELDNEKRSYWEDVELLSKNKLINKKVREERGFYDPGNRVAGYLNAKKSADKDKPRADMMDNYYGNKGTGLAGQRSDIIAEFVHKSMGYKGEYDKNKTGRDAWIDTYGKDEAFDSKGKVRFKSSLPQLDSSNRVIEKSSGENFEFHSVGGLKKQQGLYGSMEISRHVREGVKKYGGTIVFEVGGDVFFESAFVDGKMMGDTNVEIAYLLPYFAGKNSATVPFGKGKIVFQKGGKDIVPTKSLFFKSWSLKSVKENLKVEEYDNGFILFKDKDGKIKKDKDGKIIKDKITKDLFHKFPE